MNALLTAALNQEENAKPLVSSLPLKAWRHGKLQVGRNIKQRASGGRGRTTKRRGLWRTISPAEEEDVNGGGGSNRERVGGKIED